MSAEVFVEGSFLQGTLKWGWQCYTCREEEGGYGNASTAEEACTVHICSLPGDA